MHLIEKVPISELCDKHGISLVNFYKWQKQLFENGASGFVRKTNSADARRQDDAHAAKLEQLAAKLQQKAEKQAIIQYHFEHPLEVIGV